MFCFERDSRALLEMEKLGSRFCKYTIVIWVNTEYFPVHEVEPKSHLYIYGISISVLKVSFFNFVMVHCTTQQQIRQIREVPHV
jgi:hypothetical protein